MIKDPTCIIINIYEYKFDGFVNLQYAYRSRLIFDYMYLNDISNRVMIDFPLAFGLINIVEFTQVKKSINFMPLEKKALQESHRPEGTHIRLVTNIYVTTSV